MKTKCILTVIMLIGLLAAACSTTSESKDVNNEGKDALADMNTGGDVADDICTPDCEGKTCGDDGCGGSCGSCAPGVVCIEGVCPPCEPDCTGKECGDDTCGGLCGSGNADTLGCPEGQTCDNAMCVDVVVGDCTAKECGPDGAGGSCGTCPCDGCDPEATECNDDGLCEPPVACECPCIFDCLDTCPQGDQACFQNCVNSATIEGQVAYNNLITCLEENGYFECEEGDEDCLEGAFDMCMEQYYQCFHGDVECVDMYLCLIGCPAGDAGQLCTQDCFAGGNVEALITWDAFIGCLDTEGYFDCPENDDACFEAAWEACGEEFTACANGDLTCSEIYDCLGTCAQTDQLCPLSCIVHGTVDAQGSWDAMVDCIVEQCGEDTTPECENGAIEGACSGLYNACIGS